MVGKGDVLDVRDSAWEDRAKSVGGCGMGLATKKDALIRHGSGLSMPLDALSKGKLSLVSFRLSLLERLLYALLSV